MMQAVTVIMATLLISGFIGVVIYYYYVLSRKRKSVTPNDLFVLLLGGFAAGMLFLVLLRFYTGVHTKGVFEQLNEQHEIQHKIDEQAE